MQGQQRERSTQTRPSTGTPLLETQTSRTILRLFPPPDATIVAEKRPPANSETISTRMLRREKPWYQQQQQQQLTSTCKLFVKQTKNPPPTQPESQTRLHIRPDRGMGNVNPPGLTRGRIPI
ncbi:hypothetical protein CHS0354_011661 [Potamilus streckersoni]|uniref:Uncharacterized protein n=1 Tax=Potamilus streckersoni TaxID=2493646 RepID=A0AAE0WET1_9BIVA|nr:hypothetical protein CHS0354_011661 [Potamilus streckersoni]